MRCCGNTAQLVVKEEILRIASIVYAKFSIQNYKIMLFPFDHIYLQYEINFLKLISCYYFY